MPQVAHRPVPDGTLRPGAAGGSGASAAGGEKVVDADFEEVDDTRSAARRKAGRSSDQTAPALRVVLAPGRFAYR